MALSPILAQAAIFSAILALMCTGLTLTYMTTKVPNFAHGQFVTVGAYLAFTLYTFLKVNPYLSTPISLLLGGLAALAEYKLVVAPLKKRGTSITSMILAVFAVDVLLAATFGIYTDTLFFDFKIFYSKQFLLVDTDIFVLGSRGIVIIAPLAVILVTTALYLLLTRTRFGLAMQAAIENPNLAGGFGINVERVYTVSWFLAGALAGLAGSLYVLWFQGSPSIGDDFILSIFSGSVVGGLSSIYGAIVGGLLIGLGQVLVSYYAATFLGGWVLKYQLAIPLLFLAVALLVSPEGITSKAWREILRRR